MLNKHYCNTKYMSEVILSKYLLNNCIGYHNSLNYTFISISCKLFYLCMIIMMSDININKINI